MVGAEEIRLQEKELFDAFDFKSLELNIQSGVLRVGGNFNFDNSDVTLALFSARKPAIITVPQGCSLHLEALTESKFSITEATTTDGVSNEALSNFQKASKTFKNNMH